MEENDNILLPQISEKDLPDYIASQVESLKKLEKKIKASDDSVQEAMNCVKRMVRYKDGRWLLVFGSDNTEAVFKSEQEAIENIAKTQIFSVEALKQVFKFQQIISDTTKKLFALCCGNITMNMTAVRIITEKLSGASKEELSELARQELISVVRQLKAQQDILMKLEKAEKKDKDITRRLDEKDKIDEEQTQHLQKIDISLEQKGKIDKKQEEMIHSNKSEINKINIDLAEKDKIDTEQTEHLQKIDVVLEEKDKVDKKQEEQISDNKSEINKIKQLCNQQSIQINKIEESIISSNKHMKETDELYEIQLKEIKALEKKINRIFKIVIMLFVVLIAINLIVLYYKL